ncbi:A24 family peptidase [Gordonia rubripertincta]|uniref:A24 family peptidase n=1 Tax=Gordonia rubripertincta TaxID=36822 RepID=UPI000B8D93B2|nr:A24 family peptidase [Gordonia rubripertincta]ASR03535.1 Type IV leader peptidase family protein [Gordonia rubripertincta]
MVEPAILFWLLAIAVTDARTRRIPNAMVWPGLGAVAVVAISQPAVGLAAGVAAAPYLLAFTARWCGGGDVKLAFVCGGLALRWDTAMVMVACASLVTLVIALTSVGRRGHAHAPALVGALIAVADLA